MSPIDARAEQPDLTIVVVSYNVREHLERCLTSAERALERADLTGETWVVDNASSDGSPELVIQAFPRTKLIRNTTNLGFAAANNRALARAAGRHVLLLNPDAELAEDALDHLRAALQEPLAGACGPSLAYGDGTFQHSAFRFPTLAMALLDFFPLHHRLIESRLNGRYPRAVYQAGEPFPVDHTLGACLLVRGDCLRRVGLLDEGFFMYCEEIDWCWRIREAGYEILCVPRARVIHHEARSTRQFREEMLPALWRARLRLFRKHRGPLYRLLARAILLLGAARLGTTGGQPERRAAGRLARLALGLGS